VEHGGPRGLEWRLVVDGPAPAAVNMGRDEAILRAVAAGGPITLRFYSWRPWAFSLGYFQKYEDFLPQAQEGLPIVRRITGGGAIWHADELTYSLAARFGEDRFPRRAGDVLAAIHRALASGLRLLGVDAGLADSGAACSAQMCFEKSQKYDIVVEGAKLLGSAQRRRGRAFLQHGSLPLSPNAFAPSATSLSQLLENPPATARIIEVLTDAFESAFGAACVDGRLSDEETVDAEALAETKYAGDAWTRLR
jgi:lipoate-protein ligase A